MTDPRLTPERIAEATTFASDCEQYARDNGHTGQLRAALTTITMIEEYTRLSIKYAIQDIEIFGLRVSETNLISAITTMRDNSKLLLTKYRSSMQACDSRAERDHVRSMYEPEMLSALDALIEKTSGL